VRPSQTAFIEDIRREEAGSDAESLANEFEGLSQQLAKIRQQDKKFVDERTSMLNLIWSKDLCFI
jgi:hypothetical protein